MRNKRRCVVCQSLLWPKFGRGACKVLVLKFLFKSIQTPLTHVQKKYKSLHFAFLPSSFVSSPSHHGQNFKLSSPDFKTFLDYGPTFRTVDRVGCFSVTRHISFGRGPWIWSRTSGLDFAGRLDTRWRAPSNDGLGRAQVSVDTALCGWNGQV